MESIIERPRSEDGWKDFRSGTEYGSRSEESHPKDSPPSSKAESEESHPKDSPPSWKAVADKDNNNSDEDDNISEGSSIIEFCPRGDGKWELIVEDGDDVDMEEEIEHVRCDYCGGDDHFSSRCKLHYRVPKGASFTPDYYIVCEYCGEEMKNDLLCPRCNREIPGVLVPNVCYYCYCQGHQSDVCPDKQMNLPPHPRRIPLPDDFNLETYEPTSP